MANKSQYHMWRILIVSLIAILAITLGWMVGIATHQALHKHGVFTPHERGE